MQLFTEIQTSRKLYALEAKLDPNLEIAFTPIQKAGTARDAQVSARIAFLVDIVSSLEQLFDKIDAKTSEEATKEPAKETPDN